jgi:hypothetical protein
MTTPHDRLFHFTFRTTRHAHIWVAATLPAEVARAVDWQTLAPAPERVHGRQLRLEVTDLLFEARLRWNGARIAIVPEHKSYGDPNLPTKLLDYVVHVRRNWRKSRDDVPTLVVAMVLYHGETPFRAMAPPHPDLLGLDTTASAELHR